MRSPDYPRPRIHPIVRVIAVGAVIGAVGSAAYYGVHSSGPDSNSAHTVVITGHPSDPPPAFDFSRLSQPPETTVDTKAAKSAIMRYLDQLVPNKEFYFHVDSVYPQRSQLLDPKEFPTVSYPSPDISFGQPSQAGEKELVTWDYEVLVLVPDGQTTNGLVPSSRFAVLAPRPGSDKPLFKLLHGQNAASPASSTTGK